MGNRIIHRPLSPPSLTISLANICFQLKENKICKGSIVQIFSYHDVIPNGYKILGYIDRRKLVVNFGQFIYPVGGEGMGRVL